MPYCRRCGAQLAEDARFCYKCGTPVEVYTAPQAAPAPAQPARPMHKDPLIVAVIGLVVILVAAAIIVAFLFTPTTPWSNSQTLQDSTPNVDTLNLSFQADAGQINVIAQKIGANNVLIHVQANGSRGFFGNPTNFTTTFTNQTVGGTLTVNSHVQLMNPVGSTANNIVCTVYVDPALKLNLNVTSLAGQVSFSGEKATAIQALGLHSNAGEVDANVANATIAGDLSLTTNAGSVNYRMSEATVSGNRTITLHSNAGEVNVDVTQTSAMQGNVQLNASTNVGSVNLGVDIDKGVAAKITSHSNLGSIDAQTNNFSGDKSPLQSNNYPAASNIEIDCNTNVGSVNIQASYRTMINST